MICNINPLCLWWFYARRKLSRREHNEMNTTVTVMFPHLQYVLFTVNHISVFLVSVTVEILQLKIQNQMQAQQSAGPAKAWDTVARRETQSLGIHWRAGLCRSLDVHWNLELCLHIAWSISMSPMISVQPPVMFWSIISLTEVI